MDEYKNIENKIDIIIHKSCEYRHISEHVYDHVNIVRDRDNLGREVMWDATITQGSYQRTKCLTHEHQIHLQQQRLAENQWIERERKELANCKHRKKITRDEAIVGCLCKKLELGGHLSNEEVGTVKPKYLL
jgi:hypothetical protein